MSQDTMIDMYKLQGLLPAYVNGSLGVSERQWVKAALAQSAQARAALAWHEALAEKVIDDVESAPADIGWAALHAKVRASSRAVQSEVQATSSLGRRLAQAGRGLWQSLEALLPHRWMPAPAMSAVCAGLLAVVVAQAWWGHETQESQDFSQVRGDATTSAAGGVLAGSSKFVRLNFKDSVSERDMRLLLVRTGSVIVSGPGQLGDYTVAVPAGDIGNVLREFQDSLLTESVREVPAPSVLDPHPSGTTGAAPGQTNNKTLR